MLYVTGKKLPSCCGLRLGRSLGTGYPQLPRERSDASLPLFKVVAYHFHEARQSRASQLTSKSAPVTSSQVVYFQHRLSPQKRRRGKPVVGCGRSHRLFNPAPPDAWLTPGFRPLPYTGSMDRATEIPAAATAPSLSADYPGYLALRSSAAWLDL